MTEASVVPATDLFERVSVGAKPFRIWWDAVALWLERRRNPLSTTTDLHPIVNRYYRPKPGSKSSPNPSNHLWNIKRHGLLREFVPGGSDGVLEPVTDKVVLVGGKVVYTPDMLERLRELDVEKLLKNGIGAQPVSTKRAVKPPPAPPVATPDVVSHEPCLAGTGEPVMIGSQLAAYAEAVMQAARERGYAPMSPIELGEVYQRTNPQTRDLPAVTYRIERAGFLQMVSGKKKAGTAMRAVVFQPYFIRYSRNRIGEKIVPPECVSHEPATPPVVETTVEPEPVEPPVREAVEEESVEQVLSEVVEPTVETVTATGDMLAQVKAQLARLEQAKRDAIRLEYEEEKLAEHRAQITKLERLVAGLEISTTALRARLQAVLSPPR